MTVTTGEIDGVPAVWRKAPTDELTASLVFGVGWHSQSVLTRGIDEVLLGCTVGQVA